MYGPQCPVCTLYLHVGMKLEEHLETHPKEQVIKALVSLSQQNIPSTQSTQSSGTVLCGNFNNSLIQSTRVINRSSIQPPPPQQNFVIVNSTSTKFFQRRNSAYIVNDPVNNTHFLITERDSSRTIQPVLTQNQENNNSNNNDNEDITEYHSQKESFYENDTIENETYDESQQYKEYDNQENVEEFDEYIEQTEDYNDNVNTETTNKSDEEQYDLPIKAQYYEQENGDFLVQESPVVEYTENDDGEFMISDKSEQSQINVIHYPNDEEKVNDEVVEKEIEEFTEKPEETIDTELSNNKKPNVNVKVLSNVRLTPDMLSSGIKEIIISAKSAKIIDSNNKSQQIEILNRRDSIDVKRISEIPPSSSSNNEPIPSSSSSVSPCPSSVICKPIISVNNDIPADLSIATSVVENRSISPFIEPSTQTSVIIKPKILEEKKEIDANVIDLSMNSLKTSSSNLVNESFEKISIDLIDSNDDNKVVIDEIQTNTEIKTNDYLENITNSKYPTNIAKKTHFFNKAPKKLILKLKKRTEEDASTHNEQFDEKLNESNVEKIEDDKNDMELDVAKESNPKIDNIAISETINLIDDVPRELKSENIEENSENNMKFEIETNEVMVNTTCESNSSLSELQVYSTSSTHHNSTLKKNLQKKKKRFLRLKSLKKRKKQKMLQNENKRKKRIIRKLTTTNVQETSTSSSEEPSNKPFKFKKLYSDIYDMSIPGNSGNSKSNSMEVFVKEEKFDNNLEENQSDEIVHTHEIICAEKSDYANPLNGNIIDKTLEEELCDLITDIETTDYVKLEQENNMNKSETNIQDTVSKSVSWSSQITSAIETIESHISENISSPIPCSSSSISNSKTQTPVPSSNSSNDNYLAWQNFTNLKEEYSDLNQAGPSRIDYKPSNFFMGNYDQEFLYSNEKHNRYIEFIEDGQTATWRHPFSPQFANLDNDRTSYTDLDNCKVETVYNRAPSTESLNIRTDEKMPARGEISEQESNGEIDAPWSHHQGYPSYYQSEQSLMRYHNVYEKSKEDWKQNLTTFPQNITKFPPLTNTTPTQGDIPNIETAEKELKKERKPRTYRCVLCHLSFDKLKLKRAHIESEHPEYIANTKTTSTVTSTTSTIKIEETENVEEAKLFPPPLDNNQVGGIVYNSNETKIEPNSELNENRPDENIIMGFNELKEELLQNISNNTELQSAKSDIRIKKKKIYMCLKCKEEFKNLKSFNNHLVLHPAECQQCGKTFHSWYSLSIHLKRHLGIKNHVCMCGKRFLIKQKLVEHMRIHTGIAPISCPECNKKFRRYSNLIQHRNRHHLNIKPEQKDYLCHCGEVLHSKAKFIWHKEIHENRPKGCPFCRERFIHQNSLSRHIRLSHEDKYWDYQNAPFPCPICEQLFTKNSIKHHINKHNSQTEYKCNICNKTFSTKWNLKQHRWVHACRSTKPYKCKICVAAFVRETDYKTHMNVHKSIKPFTCNYCGCQFSRKYNWLRHTKEHESPKKFKCNICNKAFHRAYYLTEHMRIHTGERPFTCNICGKTSATKTNHNKHIVIHHARDPLAAEG